MDKKNKIAFQGEQGAYSHLASLEIFPKAEIKSCSTFEETFKMAEDNPEYRIVIPIENSLAGRVADIHYLIPKYRFQIHAEHFHKVNHNLLGVKGSKLEDIKIVRSHSQAIGQCQKLIIENGLKSIISADTAGSAKFVSEKNNKTESAIASTLAAKIYNLDILDYCGRKENVIYSDKYKFIEGDINDSYLVKFINQIIIKWVYFFRN